MAREMERERERSTDEGVKADQRGLAFIIYRSGTELILVMSILGGIGGVHRGAQETFDVSADLTELGRTPVAVVSSGVIFATERKKDDRFS